MRDPYAGGRRLARYVALAQLWAAVLGAVIAAWWSQSLSAAVAVAWGAGSVAAGGAVFAWRQMQGVAGVNTLLRRFYGAAAMKWLVLFAVFAIGLIVVRLPAGGLLAGLIGAQLAGIWALLRYG